MKLERGKLITKPEQLAKLKSSDRYDPSTPDGVSPRWLPGSKAETFSSQGDEHSPDGTVDESAANAKAQIDKRLRKATALKSSLNGPELYRFIDDAWTVSDDASSLDEVIIGWGSTKSVVLDTVREMQRSSPDRKIGYLHYTYLWPLKTEMIEALHAQKIKLTLVEGNALGQLGMLIRQECGISVDRKILKYDGRPFFVNELIQLLTSNA